MSRNSDDQQGDIVLTIEYIKNVLYFSTVRDGKTLRNTADIHFFCTDEELIYENYYSDFGPLNLGCVYRYCKMLNEKLKLYVNKKKIVYYTSEDPRKKANAAFLLGCFGVLHLHMSPRDALRPLMVHGQAYRPFQDATQGDSVFTITILDCLCAIKKAHSLNFFNFNDFNYDEYVRLDRIQGGDLNWIVPGKFLAFIGPVDFSVSLYHPPEMYVEYFKENNVQIVIRLNKRMYDAEAFINKGILHYDLYFPDGSCPPRHILMKFLQIAEDAQGAIAVHCKAGLGRTGSLIGCYLMKHYRMTSSEAIGWMRICRPGSVIGHQQAWLEKLEPWLHKQGNIYRKRNFGDPDKILSHEFGVYSIDEKMMRQKLPSMLKFPTPASSATSNYRTGTSSMQLSEREDEDLNKVTIKMVQWQQQAFKDSAKNIEKNSALRMKHSHSIISKPREPIEEEPIPLWKRFFCCYCCCWDCDNLLWKLAVNCMRAMPRRCANNTSLCEKTEKRPCVDRRVNVEKSKMSNTGKSSNISRPPSRASYDSSGLSEIRTPMSSPSRRGNRRIGAGEPRPALSHSPSRKHAEPIPTFRTSQGPLIKTLSEAKTYLIRTSEQKQEKERGLLAAVAVTPCRTNRTAATYKAEASNYGYNFGATPASAQRCGRRPLGRSPSPSPPASPVRQPLPLICSRASGTRPETLNFVSEIFGGCKSKSRGGSRAGSRSGSIGARSVGAASLGAPRDAPAGKLSPSVRSDDRTLATQGDLLNSIKFQRGYRKMNSDKITCEIVSLPKQQRAFSQKPAERVASPPPRRPAPPSRPSSPNTRQMCTPMPPSSLAKQINKDVKHNSISPPTSRRVPSKIAPIWDRKPSPVNLWDHPQTPNLEREGSAVSKQTSTSRTLSQRSKIRRNPRETPL